VSEGESHSRRKDDRARLPPQNLEAERCTLGALLLDVHASSPVLQILSKEDFYLGAHQHIYEAIAELYDSRSSADLVLVADALESRGLLEAVGGKAYLLELLEQVPSAANAPYYAKLVREASIRRHLVQTCTKIITQAYQEGEEAAELLNRAEQAIYEVANREVLKQFTTISDALDSVFRLVEHKERPGIPTGFQKFDEMTNGLQPSQLIIVAGRPSMGKTTFAMNIALHVAVEKKLPVAIFSLEVTREQLALNLLCSYARVNAHSVRRGTLSRRQLDDLIEAGDILAKAPIFIDDSSSLTTLEAKAKARRLKSSHKDLSLVIVDYLQLMSHSSADSREQEISAISRSLKSMARDLNVPVIAISQLSRAVEHREKEGHRPRLSDLRESGAIEQDADVVVLLYREEYYRRDDPAVKGKAEAIIAKQRNGPTGSVPLAFLADVLRFENLAHEMEPNF